MGLPSLHQMCRLRPARHTHMDPIMYGTINLPLRLLPSSKERKTTMKYQINFPEEPEGPLWDEHGSKCIKEAPGSWKRTYPDSAAVLYYSWERLLFATKYLIDNTPNREAWNQAHPGAYYWINGFDSNKGSHAEGIGYPDKNRVLHVPDADSAKNEAPLITPSEENDELNEITPVLAVPADDLIKLLLSEGAEMIHHLQNKICNWLDIHSQIHWEERTK